MVSQWIRLIECNYFEITMLMITLDSRIVLILGRLTKLMTTSSQQVFPGYLAVSSRFDLTAGIFIYHPSIVTMYICLLACIGSFFILNKTCGLTSWLQKLLSTSFS